MARLPDKSSRLKLISVFIFCSLLLLLDFRFNTFKPIQDFYNSSSIFVKIFSRESIINPISDTFNIIFKAKNLNRENEYLKDELNYQLIKNYLISNEEFLKKNIFLSENSSISFEIGVLPAKIVRFDLDQYHCCDKHRMFLATEIGSDVNSSKVVVNSQGIIGQTIELNKNLFEVILLSDKTHNVPIQNDYEYFCEAKGLGIPKKVFCDVDLTLWENNFLEKQIFYTSGMGGVFPKGVEIGFVDEIRQISPEKLRLVIKLNANPLSSTSFGVIE